MGTYSGYKTVTREELDESRTFVEAPAGWWNRVGATLLDGMFVGLPIWILAIVAGVSDRLTISLVQSVALLIYATVLLAVRNGQTLGKSAATVRVVTADGQPI